MVRGKSLRAERIELWMDQRGWKVRQLADAVGSREIDLAMYLRGYATAPRWLVHELRELTGLAEDELIRHGPAATSVESDC